MKFQIEFLLEILEDYLMNKILGETIRLYNEYEVFYENKR
jgi:hypothetical protein